MGAKSLFLTADADTLYFVGFIDFSKEPMVFEAARAKSNWCAESQQPKLLKVSAVR